MAGHSKWANIKHRKARQDQRRGKVWSKCSKAIMAAARSGGGDPDTNLGLRYAIDEAKAANMPKDTIENAIRKGAGDTSGAAFESILYEGYGPGGVAIMCDVLTDNRNRSAGEIRRMFDVHGGNLGTSGCVAYNFTKHGQILIDKTTVDEEALMGVALDAGAEDITDEQAYWQIVTEPAHFGAVRQALEAAGLAMEAAEITMIAVNTVACEGRDAQRVLQLVDVLEDHDDVQKVYANYEIADEVFASMEK